MKATMAALVAHAAAPYRACGPAVWHFARGKLGRDPVFPALLESGLFADARRILDLGCGHALLAHWLDAASQLHDDAGWPTHWPRPARFERYRGIERAADIVSRTAATLPPGASMCCGDLRETMLEPADRIVLLDVLHYLPPDAQEALLDRIRDALCDDGLLILRVGDATAGWRHQVSEWTDRLVLFAGGAGLPRLHARPMSAWLAALASRGFAVETRPMSQGTPFANTLLVARRCHLQADSGDALC
jgi:SAM-dependent methyltransferase